MPAASARPSSTAARDSPAPPRPSTPAPSTPAPPSRRATPRLQLDGDTAAAAAAAAAGLHYTFSYASRSPKRARSSPCPHGRDGSDTDHHFVSHNDGNRNQQHSYPLATPKPFAGTIDTNRNVPPVPPVPPSAGGAAPVTPMDRWALHVKYAAQPATSPAYPKRTNNASTRPCRRRETSVPLLSQSLSSFSLSKSTPPLDSEPSPDALTRPQASSTPPALTTPETVTDTPQRPLPMRALNTPAPLARELAYPNTAPMPVIHSLLGSPFAAKSRPLPFDATSPTWATRGKGDFPSHPLEWQPQPQPQTFQGWLDNDAPQLVPASPTMDRTFLRRRSSDEVSESCTSASSYVSAEQHPSTAQRPESRGGGNGGGGGGGAPSFWGDDGDGASPTTPLRPLLSPKGTGLRLDSRPLYGYGGVTPLIKRTPEATTQSSSQEASPVQPLRLNHFVSSSATNSDDAQPPCSPSDSFFARRLNPASSTRKRDKRPVSCLIMGDFESHPMMTQRRTSEPDSLDPGAAFDEFLARCNGQRATKSELLNTRHSGSPTLFSDPSDLDNDFSPLRPLSKSALPQMPSRPSGLAALPLPKRFEKRGMSTPMAKRNVTRSNSTRVPHSAGPIRPGLPRRSTGDRPTGTPVSQLFGDDKPSPAAFASTGLVKKRGGKFKMPRFQDMIRGRNSSPMNPADTPSKTESLADTAKHDDWDEGDQLSPIKPLRPAQFGRTGSHARIPSTASVDMMNRSSHIRIPSTTSSIGCRGLRRKGSSIFGNMSDSMSDKGSPLTPTRTIPFGTLQASTPTSTATTPQYPFHQRTMSDASISPLTTPLSKSKNGRIRALSSRGPIPRSSNPMLAASYRSQAQGTDPTTPVGSLTSMVGDRMLSLPFAGPFERDYTVLSSIGEGEFSRVWKVKHKETGDLWAVKQGKTFTGPKNRQRQLEEVMILKRLTKAGHPNVIKFADSWEQSDKLYIRTELLTCGDFGLYLASVGDYGGLDEGRVWKVLVELTSAVQFIHAHSILHLDIKPSNMLLTNEGSLKIADFGMSVLHQQGDGAMGNFPEILDRDLEGDREYLCPEALLDIPPGPEADVYSLGITILEAALNIALPSNGEAWVKLRNDDFSDIEEHLIERGKDVIDAIDTSFPGDPPPVIVSGALVDTIKRMMASDPLLRMPLADVADLLPMVRASVAMLRGRGTDGEHGWRASPALVDEDKGWLEYILGEE